MRDIHNGVSRLDYSSLSFRPPCDCRGEASFNHNKAPFLHEKGHHFSTMKAPFMREDRGMITPLSTQRTFARDCNFVVDV